MVRTSRQLIQELGREPTPEEIAEKMNYLLCDLFRSWFTAKLLDELTRSTNHLCKMRPCCESPSQHVSLRNIENSAYDFYFSLRLQAQTKIKVVGAIFNIT